MLHAVSLFLLVRGLVIRVKPHPLLIVLGILMALCNVVRCWLGFLQIVGLVLEESIVGFLG